MDPANSILNYSNANIFQKLHQTLFQENALFAQLSALLSAERSALELQDIEEVNKYSTQKQQLTQNLERLAEVRILLLDHLELTLPTRQNDDSQKSDRGQQLLPSNILSLWQEILQNVTQCHDKNTINGKIIKASQESITRSLQLLKSQSGDPGLTYTARGQTNTRFSSSSTGTLRA